MKELRTELIKYALWYDRCTMPEDCQTPECDIIQNVDSYIALHPDISDTETTELIAVSFKSERFHEPVLAYFETACCKVSPIYDENFCPSCGRRIKK